MDAQLGTRASFRAGALSNHLVVPAGRGCKTRPVMRLPAVRGGPLVAVAVASVLAAGCGDEEVVPERVAGTPEPGHARAVARNPYALTCGDLRRQTAHPESAKLVIRAEFALAQVPALRKRVAKETLNRTGRSVYFALTEVCKGRDPSFRPARLAVEAVREGKYLAARNRPG